MFEIDADENVQSLVTASLVDCTAFRSRLYDLQNQLVKSLEVELAFDLVVLANKFMLLGLKGKKR
jgi:hypothetical protein